MMRKITLAGLSLLLITNINTTKIQDELCKSNVLHYAVSINDINYIHQLLDNHNFNLTDFNHQCDTAHHIAIMNNNIEALNVLFSKIELLDVQNYFGENLLQYSIKHQQPEIMLALINKGLNPETISGNKLNSYEYQDKYGNAVTQKILDSYQQNIDLNELQIYNTEYKSNLDELMLQLEDKEELLNQIKNEEPENSRMITFLSSQINLLKGQIVMLRKLIFDKNSEIQKLRSVLNESGIDFNINTDEDIIRENANQVLFDLLNNDNQTKEKHNLIDISSDGESLSDSLKIFDILSRPIYKVKEKEGTE